MKINLRLIIIASISLFQVSAAFGDFVCSSNVSYKWKVQKDLDPKEHKKAETAPDTKEGDQPSGVDTIEVFVAKVQITAPLEADGKSQISNVIDTTKSRADALCRDAHENQSKCLGAKFTANAGILASISFDQRKILEDGIIQDCKKQSGVCLGSSNTEVQCTEIKKAEEAAAEPAADAKGGDKKKKK